MTWYALIALAVAANIAAAINAERMRRRYKLGMKAAKLAAAAADLCSFSGHQNAIIDTQTVDGQALTGVPYATVVLLRCSRCSENRTAILAGIWTVEKLQRRESEYAELERMVGQ